MKLVDVARILFGKLPVLTKAQELLERDSEIIISDLSFGAKSILLAAFSIWGQKNLFLITESESDARNYYSNLAIFLGADKVINLDSLLSRVNPEIEFLRLRNNDNDIKVFILSLKNLAQELISREDFYNLRFKISIGQDFSREKLLKRLVGVGYSFEKRVFSPGTFSKRGDIVDIFGIDFIHPLRIEFLGSTIDKIYEFDPIYQTKIEGKQDAEIFPFIGEKKIGAILSWFSPTDTFLVLDEPEKIYTDLIEIFNQKEALADLAKLESVFNQYKKIKLETFANNKKGIRLSWLGPGRLNNSFEFINQIKGFLKERYLVIISSADTVKILKLLNQSGIPAIRLEKTEDFRLPSEGVILGDFNLNGGVRIDSEHLVIFSDLEIMGQMPERKLEAQPIPKNLEKLLALSEGDYVVHLDHGISKFEGIGKIKVGNIEREYIHLQFADHDKLFVPVDQADRLTKYIGIGDGTPDLSRLGGEAWQRVREQARKITWILAKELIETQALREVKKGFSFGNDSEEQRALEDSFAYQVTADQKKAIEEVLADMMKPRPMDRLVCGDVGYGKTEVAIRAAMRAVVSGKQVVLLAPTTILVEQHEETFKKRFKDFPIKIESISRFKTTAAQQEVLSKLASGELDIVIGTHRLLSGDVKFKDLGLVIIDEEQRFGVRHKEKLKQLRSEVDVLTLTATPIPRTLHMALGGLRDISVINTAPEGRLPIKTKVAPFDDRLVKQAIEEEIGRGGQVYFVHNRVQTIEAVAAKLRALVPEAKIVVAHGQMKESYLASVMNDFAQGKFNVLVCSAIIESGLDISNVNTLIVDRSTHFGLSQLHQLRGRIGRSERQAFAYFLYRPKDLVGRAKQRLEALRESTELGAGFTLSLQDLSLRGAGNILGPQQHGAMSAVGIGFYLKLLADATRELKTGIAKKEFQTSLDLPLSAFLPDSYVKNKIEKIKIYQRLAAIDNLEELNQEKMNIIQKFGELPEEAVNLFKLIELKILATKAEVLSIKVKEVILTRGTSVNKVIIELGKSLSPETNNKLLAISKNWHISPLQLKINISDLGADWLDRIFETIRVIGASQISLAD